MDVEVTLEDGVPVVRVDSVHPIALEDAINSAVAAALRLHAALVPADTD